MGRSKIAIVERGMTSHLIALATSAPESRASTKPFLRSKMIKGVRRREASKGRDGFRSVQPPSDLFGTEKRLTLGD